MSSHFFFATDVANFLRLWVDVDFHVDKAKMVADKLNNIQHVRCAAYVEMSPNLLKWQSANKEIKLDKSGQTFTNQLTHFSFKNRTLLQISTRHLLTGKEWFMIYDTSHFANKIAFDLFYSWCCIFVQFHRSSLLFCLRWTIVPRQLAIVVICYLIYVVCSQLYSR